MNGKDYRACVRLSTPDDETLALPGETCEHVDPNSLGWLLNQGLVEPTAYAWTDLGAPAAPVVDPPIDTAPLETPGTGDA